MRILMLMLFITACAKSNHVDQPGKDPLLASWVSEGAPAWTVDLSETEMNKPSPVWWTYEKGIGGECISVATMTETVPGDSSAGTMTVQYSTAAISKPGDPPCTMFDQTWSWTRAGGKLTLCGSASVGPCVEFN